MNVEADAPAEDIDIDVEVEADVNGKYFWSKILVEANPMEENANIQENLVEDGADAM